MHSIPWRIGIDQWDDVIPQSTAESTTWYRNKKMRNWAIGNFWAETATNLKEPDNYEHSPKICIHTKHPGERKSEVINAKVERCLIFHVAWMGQLLRAFRDTSPFHLSTRLKLFDCITLRQISDHYGPVWQQIRQRPAGWGRRRQIQEGMHYLSKCHRSGLQGRPLRVWLTKNIWTWPGHKEPAMSMANNGWPTILWGG